jgi:hypothetical protein
MDELAQVEVVSSAIALSRTSRIAFGTLLPTWFLFASLQTHIRCFATDLNDLVKIKGDTSRLVSLRSFRGVYCQYPAK